MDSTVFKRSPTPEVAWLLCAKAFAEAYPKRALAAYRNAYLINPAIANRINSNWCLANLLDKHDF